MKKKVLMMTTALALVTAGCAAPAAQAPQAETAATAEAAEEAVTVAAEEDTTEAAAEAATEEAAGEHKVIAPLPVDVDVTNLADGIYHVDMKSVENTGDGVNADVVLYTVDLYDAVDVTTMQPGDTFVIRGEEVTVNTFEETESVTLTNADGEEETYAHYELNGHFYEDGIELIAGEGGTFRYYGMDDYPSFTEQGEITLPVAADAVITDKAHILDDPEGQLSDPAVTQTTEEFAEGFEKESTTSIPYTYFNTTVRTEGGVIVEITRIFTP